MAYLTVGGFGCARGRVLLPRQGVWVADVLIEPTDGSGPPPGVGSKVSVVLNGSLSLTGTVRRAQNAYGALMARIVGGAGGFPTSIPSKAYLSVPLRMPFSDLLSEIGESLSVQSYAQDLTPVLPFWVRGAGPAYRAMGELMGQIPSDNWRILPDGTTWIGQEQWQPTSMPYELISYQPNELKMVVYSDTPIVLPGQSLQGQFNVSTVEHIVEHDKVRTVMLFEDPALAQLVSA